MITVLNDKTSIFNQFLSEIRDVNIQKDKMRFRRNLERMGEIMAYEISKEINFKDTEIQTPLGISKCKTIEKQPVIASIMRAGLPLHQGFLNYFDNAENSFISAYRKYNKNDGFNIKLEYLSTPDLTNKTLILSDTMLATGTSIVLAYKALLKNGTPKKTYIVSLIASNEGVEYLKKHLPQKNTKIFLGAVDNELTAHSYIVPGLGDAGDLAYGEKQ